MSKFEKFYTYVKNVTVNGNPGNPGNPCSRLPACSPCECKLNFLGLLADKQTDVIPFQTDQMD
jgi:hypothetical protein